MPHTADCNAAWNGSKHAENWDGMKLKWILSKSCFGLTETRTETLRK